MRSATLQMVDSLGQLDMSIKKVSVAVDDIGVSWEAGLPVIKRSASEILKTMSDIAETAEAKTEAARRAIYEGWQKSNEGFREAMGRMKQVAGVS